jgi:hypothetical protein
MMGAMKRVTTASITMTMIARNSYTRIRPHNNEFGQSFKPQLALNPDYVR